MSDEQSELEGLELQFIKKGNYVVLLTSGHESIKCFIKDVNGVREDNKFDYSDDGVYINMSGFLEFYKDKQRVARFPKDVVCGWGSVNNISFSS